MNTSDLVFGPDGRLYLIDVSDQDRTSALWRAERDGSQKTLVYRWQQGPFIPSGLVFDKSGDLFVGSVSGSVGGSPAGVVKIIAPGLATAGKVSAAAPLWSGESFKPPANHEASLTPEALFRTGPYKNDLLFIYDPNSWRYDTHVAHGSVLRQARSEDGKMHLVPFLADRPDLRDPGHLAVADSGDVFVTYSEEGQIVQFDPVGRFKKIFANVPHANRIAIGADGKLYVTNTHYQDNGSGIGRTIVSGGLSIFDSSGKMIEFVQDEAGLTDIAIWNLPTMAVGASTPGVKSSGMRNSLLNILRGLVATVSVLIAVNSMLLIMSHFDTCPPTLAQYVAWIFGLWARIRFGQHLGPGLGMIGEGVVINGDSQLGLDGPPPSELIDPAIRAAMVSSTGQWRNTNLWAAALETQCRCNQLQTMASPLRFYPYLEGYSLVRRLLRPRVSSVLTTYGLVNTGKAIRLSVIHYLRPVDSFLASRTNHINLNGQEFAVIIRPWLKSGHAGTAAYPDGNCWVTFFDGAGQEHKGILTALHALKSTKRSPREVLANVSRAVPKGTVHYKSKIMDTALISIQKADWSDKVPIQHSTVVGFKPVRFLTGRGAFDGEIVEHSGFLGATVPGQSGKEPLAPVLMFFNRRLEPGDSGCLVLDREHETYGGEARPYLIYLGVINLRFGGVQGYGILIDQVNKTWPLHCYKSQELSIKENRE